MKKITLPTRRDFILPIKNDKGITLCEIEYKQASINEHREFLSLSTESQFIYCINLALKSIKLSFIEKMIKKVFKNYKTKKEIQLYYNFYVNKSGGVSVIDLVEKIIKSKFKMYESIYDGYKKEKEEKRPYIEIKSDIAVAKELDEKLVYFLENYTLEQYGVVVDKLVFDYYESDDEGKKINDKATGFVEDRVKEGKEKGKQIREMFEAKGMKF